MPKDCLKILFLNSEYNGVAYWRMFEPARWLNQSCPDVAVTYFPVEGTMGKTTSEWERLALSHDLIVCARVSEPESLQTMLVMRELSEKPMVVELDDDFLHVDKHNLSYPDWAPGTPAYALAEKQVQMTDMLQVSTFPLKQLMGYKYSKETWVSPNLIDVDRMTMAIQKALPKRKTRDHIRIGWAGGANHYGDFLGFFSAWKEIAAKYPNVQFVFRGMKADYFSVEQDKTEIRDKKMHFMKGCPIDLSRVEFGEGAHFWVWPELLADMDIDIVIVPLADTRFNKSKSNARYLEFSSLGIPGVYADVYPYTKTITDGVDGFLARNTVEWVAALSRLIEEKELRLEMGKKARQTVDENYSFQNNIDIWRENLEAMANRSSEMKFVPYYKEAENG